MWPFNRGWPFNGGPLNRGSTVLRLVAYLIAYLGPVHMHGKKLSRLARKHFD
jgi:hypothetical protein